MVIESLGIIAMSLGIIGVILNNRKLRVCFIIWLLSNLICAGIHAYANIWSLFARDVVFFGLAIDGWLRWGPGKRAAE